MMRPCVLAIAAAVLLTVGATAAPVPAYIKAAVADPLRPESDTKTDGVDQQLLGLIHNLRGNLIEQWLLFDPMYAGRIEFAACDR